MVESVETKDDDQGNVAIKIKTKDGYDLISSSFNGDEVADHYGLKSDAKIAVINNNKPRLFDGTKLEFNGKSIITQKRNYTGVIVGYGISESKDKSWYEIDHSIDLKPINQDQIIFIEDDDGISRGYPIQYIDIKTNRVYVKYDYKGFKSYPASTFHIMNVVSEFNSNQNIDGGKGNRKKGLSSGGIAGIIIAVLVVIAAVVIGVLFYMKKNKRQTSEGILSTKIDF